MSEHKPPIGLVALDLDGTLLNSHGCITEGSKEAIRKAAAAGVHIAIATGRPFSQLPLAQLADLPIEYAMTANGASAYRIRDRRCLFETDLPDETVRDILGEVLQHEVHITCFIHGSGVTPDKCRDYTERLIVPPNIKVDYYTTRKYVPDLRAYILENQFHVEKFTLNFIRTPEGELVDRDYLEKWLKARADIDVVCGGYSNLEITKKGIDKGVGLYALADCLGFAHEATMAIGDAGNDLAILRAAGIGVCMANGDAECLAAADYITASNEAEGVARAFRRFLPIT